MLKSAVLLVNVYLSLVKCYNVHYLKPRIQPTGTQVLNQVLPSGNMRSSLPTISEGVTPGYPCEMSATVVSIPGTVCKGQLLFEDNFNADLADDNIWTPEVKFPGEPDFPFNVYMQGDYLKVKDGKLIIKPTLLNTEYGEDSVWQPLDLSEGCTGKLGTSECKREPSGPMIIPPIITGKVTTKQKFSFKYGRVEIRAKMPRGEWLVPEIQLEPRDSVYGARNYGSGLLRIACVKGNIDSSKILLGGPIMSESEPYRSAYLKQMIGNEPWRNDFHTYTLEWRPESIMLSMDGVIYGQVVPPMGGFYDEANKNKVEAATRWAKGTIMAPFDDMFYISLGITVGGVHEFPDGPNKPWKNDAPKAMFDFWKARGLWNPTWMDSSKSLEVDYVKVFAL